MPNTYFTISTNMLPSWAKAVLISALLLQSSGLMVPGTFGAFQASAFIEGNSVTTADASIIDDVVVVKAADLGDDKVAELTNPTSWFFYNDENDTIDNNLGSFVDGPDTPPLGEGSAQIGVSGTQRRNLATYMFRDVALADITEMSFVTYNPSAGNGGSATRSAYLNFNVSFDGNDTWQKRLSFVPTQNDTVLQDTWQEWDAIDGGNALWGWSGFAANGNQWPDGATSTLRTWNDLLASFPNISTRASDSWLGLRVGEPYANGYTENIDSFTFGTTDGWNATTTVYDFEPDTVTNTSETIVVTPGDMKGWAFGLDSGVTGQGEMVSGPIGQPLGLGSARLATPASNDGSVLGAPLYLGTRLDQIEELRYSTYRTVGGPAQAIALQFNIDADLTDAVVGWQGRLIYEPYYTETVTTGVWQEWNTLTQGRWWFSNGTLAGTSGCGIGTPCTWAQIIAAFPNAGVHNSLGGVLFKAGSNWAGFDGNVDNFVFGLKTGSSVHTVTYNFEVDDVVPYVPSAGDIVINEVMWMGSDPSGGSTADEWIELYNTTAEEIDLAGWKIENLGTQDDPDIIIPSGTISAGGYFLIGNYSSTHINSAVNDFITVDYATTAVNLINSGEQLTLRDGDDNIIDQTPTGTWAAGNNTTGFRQSMERNNVPGDGTLPASWHTCIDSGCTSTAFWDVSGDNYGTPKALNLSENDPTMPDYVEQDWSHTIGWEADDNDVVDDSELESEEPEVTGQSDTTSTPEVGPEVSDIPDETEDDTNGGGGGGGGDVPLAPEDDGDADINLKKDEDESDVVGEGEVSDEAADVSTPTSEDDESVDSEDARDGDDEADTEEDEVSEPEPADSESEVVSEAE